jgi:hypothetical protein
MVHASQRYKLSTSSYDVSGKNRDKICQTPIEATQREATASEFEDLLEPASELFLL